METFAHGKKNTASGLSISLVRSADGLEAVQRLRHQVFVEELGAIIPEDRDGIETDQYDPHCDHIAVHDSRTGQVVACARLLDGDRARRIGGFYAALEFDLATIDALPGRVVEIGRTCVHPAYRNGPALTHLWSGLADYVREHGFDYLIGCVGIPLIDGSADARAIMRHIRSNHLAPSHWRVHPHLSLPSADSRDDMTATLPPLLASYLTMGAHVCGEPSWAPDLQLADIFVLLDTNNLPPRYSRRFLGNDSVSPKTDMATA